MPDSNRNSTWRQGDIFVLSAGADEEVFGIIASHDCDICADADAEPDVEVVWIKVLVDVGGQFVYAKNPRRLHCRTLGDGSAQGAVEMLIRERTCVDKNEFFQTASLAEFHLLDTDIVVFRSWLAGRYARSAFPNAFEDRLSPRLRKKIDKLSEKSGKQVRALYFDLDDGRMNEWGEDDTYELRIHVVYETETDEDGEMHKFAATLSEAFKSEFYSDESQEWHGVALLSCEATSAFDFPLVLANAMKPWRVDHRSYQELPDAVYPDPGR